MRRHHAGVLIAWLLVAVGRALAEDPPSSGGSDDAVTRHKLPEAQDAYFASNHYTGMSLLHLRKDGTFAEYGREHMFIAQGDEGRWKQTDAGELLLCSHSHFKSLHAGELMVFPREDDVAGLPALLAAIEGRLSASPATLEFGLEDLRPVVVRTVGAKDESDAVPPGAIAPTVTSFRERVQRKDLEELASRIRQDVVGRSSSLTSRVAVRYRNLVWLSEHAAPSAADHVEKDMLAAYREHKEGPFLPGMATVAVDAETFAGLLGTRQPFSHYPEMNVMIPRRALLLDFRRQRVASPLCGDFSEGTAALAEIPKASATVLPAGEAAGFAMDDGAGARLLLLNPDGRFSEYEQAEKNTTLSDEGQWAQEADGLLRLCSHAAFRPVTQERLSLSVDEATYAKLPGLLSAMRGLLTSSQTRASFTPKQIEGVANRALPRVDLRGKSCACPRIAYGREPVKREQVTAFVSALDEYLRSGTANLVVQRIWAYGATVWLGDPAGARSADIVRTLRALGEGPCLLPEVLVRVPMPTFSSMRGAAAATPAFARRLAVPLCAGFGAPGRAPQPAR